MFLNAIFVTLLFAQVTAEDPFAPYRQAAEERWEKDIRELESLDSRETDPPDAILFIGSSSIRMWDSMAEDMVPWPTIRRGYGGAKLSDLGVFVERLTKPHAFRALVIFVANDISGGEQDKSPEKVLELYQHIVEKIRKSRPTEPIYFVGITPSSSRFQVWPEIRNANQLIRKYCESSPHLYYIDTAQRYLNAEGMPNDALFKDDKLHLNRQGYKLWGEIIQAKLNETLEQ